MTDTVKRIMEDNRPIYGLSFEDDVKNGGFFVGPHDHEMEKIIPYEEYGDMAPVTWFAVYRGGEIFVRVPARMVVVHYVTQQR